MPARKKTIDEWSVRITPADQAKIPEEDFLESGLKDAEQLIVCEEGEPNGSPRLHYHIYLKSTHSRTTLERMCAKMGRANNSVKGNAVFSIKQANTGTIGYVVKDRNVITSIGYDNHTLDEYFELSQQYKRDLEASRRKDSRKKETSYKEIFDNIIVSSDTDVRDIITEVLDECAKRQMNFPSRSLMETNIFRVMYPHRPDYVRSFYMKTFQDRF